MVVKLNARNNLNIIINGIDFSKNFESLSASYSSLNLPDNGLCQMTGTLQLVQTENTNIDFDTRFNSLWRRGAQIDISYQGEALPICGRAYIISADYDMASTLVISFGGALSLYNFRSADDVGVCVEFGAEFPVGQAIFDMIEASGVPVGLINISPILALNRFTIAEPLLIGSTQSILQAAGSLAAQYGHILVQLNSGIITLIDVTVDNEYVHYNTAEEVQSYERISQPESIVSQINFNYNIATVCSALNTEAQSVRSGDTIVEIVETRDETLRTTFSEIKEFRELSPENVALISTTEINSTFEPESVESISQPRNGEIVPLNQCFPDSASRLLFKEIVSTSDNTEVLKAWLATQSTAIEPSSFNVSGVITSERTTEQYTYTDTSITKITEIFQPAGLAVPLFGDRALGRAGDPNFIADIDPTTLLIADRIIETWTKAQSACLRYNYSRTVFRNRYLVRPEDLTQQALDATIGLQTISDEAQQLVPIARETLFNQDEPTVETFATDLEVAQEPNSFTIGSPPSDDFQVARSVDLGSYNNFDLEFFQRYGSRIMDFYNGRIYGMQVAANPFNIRWPEVLPLARTKIKEPSALRQDVASVFLMDTPTLVISKTEAVLSYVGSFIGFSNEPFNTSFFSDTVQAPPTLPTSVALNQVAFDDVSYSINSSFTFTYNV